MSSGGGSRSQVNRLLALVPYLQARGEVSVDEAAREFGVRPATIRRDINVLLFCGLPGLGMGDLIDVDFDALEGEGVIRLSNADYLTRPLRLDSTEAAALVVGLRALLEGGSEAEREVVERALRKIEEAAGEAGVAARVAAQVDIRPTEDPDEQAIGAVLGRAVAGGRQVRLTHRSATRDEVTVRVVDPIAITSSEGHGYLDAWCHLVEDRRLFRLDRVADAELLDTPVTEHAAAEPLDLSQGIYRPAPDDLLARLRVAPQARWVTEYYPVEEVTEEPDGSLTVSLRVSHPEWLVRLALRLGGHAVVLEPEELAAAVRRSAEEALHNYG